MSTNNTQHLSNLRSLFTIGTLTIVLSACGAGSSGGGESLTPLVSSNNGSASVDKLNAVYPSTAPNPVNEDVQFFREYIWEELAATTCADCHVPNGQRSDFAFVHPTDINAAFNSIDGLRGSDGELYIDLGNPANSRLATIVGEGHFCWIVDGEDADCAEDIEGYIAAWAAAAAPSSFMAFLQQFASEGDEITVGTQLTADAPTSYSTLYQIVRGDGIGGCAQCHAAGRPASLPAGLDFLGPQRPYFAVDDMEASYDEIKSRVDVNTPTNSRIYDRLNRESHQCWTDSCASDASVILSAINTMITDLPEAAPDGDLLAVASRALTIGGDGIVLSNSGARADSNAVALWDFKRPEVDSSQPYTATNESPSAVKVDADLSFTGNDQIEWWAAGGVTINEGRLQTNLASSAAIVEALRDTGEYSIEAWVIPQNVTQGGDGNPASIVSMSGSLDSRFFMLSQREYSYDFYNRNTLNGVPADAEGLPVLATDDEVNDEIAQASLQHVVVTYSQVDGRRIYVNNELIIEEDDPALAGGFDDWQGNFFLTVGNETAGSTNDEDDNYRQWKGAIRLLAIHNKALNVDDIQTNYEIGVGEKYYLTFAVGHLVDGLDDLYVVFRVEQFDDHSYLFSEPIFYTKNDRNVVDITDLDIAGIRIGINAREVTTGQAFSNISVSIDDDSLDYIVDFEVDENGNLGDEISANGGMQRLSRIGSLIPQEKGLDDDEFFLYFETIGDKTYTPVAPVITLQETVYDDTPRSDIGVKNFAEINASLAALTGISEADGDLINSDGAPIYEVVQQQMPSSENFSGFVSANQMGVAQLAFQYCDLLVEDGGNSTVDFGAFDFNATPATAFDTNAEKDLIISPLLENLLADDSASHSPDQPTAGDFGDGGTRDILSDLIDELVTNGSASTENIVKATCAAAYSSALMLIQ